MVPKPAGSGARDRLRRWPRPRRRPPSALVTPVAMNSAHRDEASPSNRGTQPHKSRICGRTARSPWRTRRAAMAMVQEPTGELPEVADAELVVRASAGGTDAFGELYRRHAD